MAAQAPGFQIEREDVIKGLVAHLLTCSTWVLAHNADTGSNRSIYERSPQASAVAPVVRELCLDARHVNALEVTHVR